VHGSIGVRPERHRLVGPVADEQPARQLLEPFGDLQRRGGLIITGTTGLTVPRQQALRSARIESSASVSSSENNDSSSASADWNRCLDFLEFFENELRVTRVSSGHGRIGSLKGLNELAY
jgi:hypothetical protein